MERTKRLYHADPELRTFEASVLELRPGPEGTWEAVLDRTAFYPTGGGQPHDLGTVAGVPVTEVLEEGEVVIHRLAARPPEGTVRGEVDWARRVDHRQQHTGQHILSRAFVDLFGADTVGFHLGAERCTIDLNREDLDEAALDRAEARANEVVTADVPVAATWYDDPASLPSDVRKEAPVAGAIRVVAVGDFDATPCCGTHCPRSGQVGPIKVLRTERKKGGIRVEFVCGGRALGDYARRHRALRSAALALTTEEFEVPERVLSLLGELKDARSRLEKTEAELRDRLVAEWAGEPHAGRFARDLGPGRAAWLAPAATELAGRRREPVLLVSAEGEGVKVALAVPPDSGLDAGALARPLLAAAGGRGGGSKLVARGQVPAGAEASLFEHFAAGGPEASGGSSA
jgi:alanyl-tRNA synthetase